MVRGTRAEGLKCLRTTARKGAGEEAGGHNRGREVATDNVNYRGAMYRLQKGSEPSHKVSPRQRLQKVMEV